MPIGRRGAAVAVALLLVTAGVGIAEERGHEQIAPVQEGQAIAPIVVVGAAVAGAAAYAAVDEYLGGRYDAEEVEEMIDGEDEQQKVDLSTNAMGAGETASQYQTASHNRLQDSRSIASMKAKAALAAEINNGTNDVGTLTDEMNETIDDYYSGQQINTLNRWETHAVQFAYTVDTAHEDGGIGPTEITKPASWGEKSNQAGNCDSETGTFDVLINGTAGPGVGTGNSSITLANGSTSQQTHVALEWENRTEHGCSENWEELPPTTHYGLNFHDAGDNWNHTVNPSFIDGAGVGMSPRWVTVEIDSNESIQDVDGGHTVINRTAWNELYEAQNESAEQVKTNYGPEYVETVVAQYQAGEIDTSELVAPEILANEWGTGYEQTGDSTYQWASFAALGVDMPNLNETAAMQVEYVAPRETRQVTLNVSGADNLNDDPPYNVTLERADGSQERKTIVDENGTAHNAVFEIPIPDGPEVADVTFLLTTPSSGSIEEWTESGLSVGFEGANIDSEESFNASVTRWGMLFASDSPSGGWNVSEEYDADDHGSVYFAPEDGQLNLVQSNFTVHQIVNDSGGNLSTVSVRSYNEQTTDPSNFTDEVDSNSELREEVEARAEPAGTGIGLPGLGSVGGVGLVALLAAAFLFLRD